MMRFVTRGAAALRTALAVAVLSVMALPATAAFAAPISLQNVGVACTRTDGEFQINITGVRGPTGGPDGTLAPSTISVTFKDVTTGLEYTGTISRTATPGGTAQYTFTQSTLVGILGVSPTVAANLVIVSGSADLASGVTYNSFVISHCPPATNPGTQIPEVPLAAVYPALGVATLAASYGLRRLRRRSSDTGVDS